MVPLSNIPARRRMWGSLRSVRSPLSMARMLRPCHGSTHILAGGFDGGLSVLVYYARTPAGLRGC